MPEESEVFEGPADDSMESEEDFEAELESHAVTADGDPIEAGSDSASDDEEKPEPEAEPTAEVKAIAAHMTKGIRDELTTVRRENQQITGRFAQLVAALQEAGQEPATPVTPPSFDNDPAGYIDHTVKDAVEPLVTAHEQEQSARDDETVQAYIDQANQFVANDRVAFSENTPDFEEAEKYMLDVDVAQAQMLYPTATEEQLHQYLMQTKWVPMQLAYFKSGTSIAEAVYETAKRLGYQPANGKPAGKKAAVTPQQARERKRQSRTVGETPPGTPRKTETAKEILALNDDEYQDWLDQQKNPEKAEMDLAKRFLVEI